MDTHHLKEAGLKSTNSRRKILEILEQSEPRHLNAEQIYQKLQAANERISLATVYRVLTQFEEAKLVLKHSFEGTSAIYELASGDHHDHMVCIKCGGVTEFFDDIIECRQKHVAQQAGFTLCDHNLIMYGICSACQ